MHDNPAEVGGADAVDHPAAAGERRLGCGELAGRCSALAAEVAAVAGRPRLGEPAAEMLGYAVRALRLAADLVGLTRPYERRCELGWAVFGSGGDWAVCSPPADAGRLRMPTATRAGCVVHLASAVTLGLGTLDAGQGVRDAVADRIRQAAAGEDNAGGMCQLGKQSQLTSDLFYRCHGDPRFGRYVFTGSGRRASGCIVHLVEQSLRGVSGTVQATAEARAAVDQAVARRRAGGLPPGTLAAATLSRFRELSQPLRYIPPYPHPQPDRRPWPGTPAPGTGELPG